ncbi:hypothetical protein H9P43_009621 [Blastocladiella emersonii ATCC 22665]|nr:hypothetical protein H9P43_009621 [Blastocladiella emersonii ATCC 22665]
MKLITLCALLALLATHAAAESPLLRRAPVQPGGLPAPSSWGLFAISAQDLGTNGWIPYDQCMTDFNWRSTLDLPDAGTHPTEIDLVTTFRGSQEIHDGPNAYVWADGKFLGETATLASTPNTACADYFAGTAVIERDCWTDPAGSAVPKATVVLPPGTKEWGIVPKTGSGCASGAFRMRVGSAAYCAGSSQDYAVPRNEAAVVTAKVADAQAACDAINADLAPVSAKNADEVKKLGIDCVGLGKKALIASWNGDTYGQPGLQLTLPSVATGNPMYNIANPSTALPPICKLRKTGEIVHGPTVDTAYRVIETQAGTKAADAAAVCAKRGLALADLRSGNSWTQLLGLMYTALGARGSAWIRSYNGNTYVGSCIALTVGDALNKGAITVPPSQCNAVLDAVVCQPPPAPVATTTAVPLARRAEF